MIKWTINFKDYNDKEHTGDYYFNLTKTEIVKMQYSAEGGYAEMIQRAIDSENGRVIMDVIEEFIDKSYGVKSLDGKRFEKSPELTAAFKQSPAYDELFMELVTNAEKTAEFIKGILPVIPEM